MDNKINYDGFPLFTELKRKETARGIVCLDRVWWVEERTMKHSVTLDYEVIGRGTYPEAQLLYDGLGVQI